MSKRDELITRYADDLKNKCGVEPDLDLLTKVTIGCGPSIYKALYARRGSKAATFSGCAF